MATVISVKLMVESRELSQSYQKPQIVPPGKSAGFDIVFCSPIQQKFSAFIRYIVN